MPFKEDDLRKSLRPRKEVGTPENGAPPKRIAIGSFYLSTNAPEGCMYYKFFLLMHNRLAQNGA